MITDDQLMAFVNVLMFLVFVSIAAFHVATADPKEASD